MIPGIRYIDYRGRERFYDENGKSIPAKPVKKIEDCFEITTIGYVAFVETTEEFINRDAVGKMFFDTRPCTIEIYCSSYFLEQSIRKDLHAKA